jgi:S1-C subfamily serine protease
VLETLRGGRSIAWTGAMLGYPPAADLANRGLPEGLWIQGVVPGTGAAAAGLEEGDYVVAIDGRPVGATLSGWCAAAAGVESGQTAQVSLDAGQGRQREVTVGFE